MQDSERPPFRRQIFFISGFDPRGVLFLHKNCVAETEKWSGLTGHLVKTGPRKNLGKLVRRWMITSDLPSGAAETAFDFLQWDDIIRQHWEKRNWLVYLQSLAGTLGLMRDGVWMRTIRESWPIAVVMSAPAATALLHGLSVIFALIGLAGLYFFPGLLGKLIALLLISGGGGLLYWVRRNMDRYKPEWNGRIGLFAGKIAPSIDHAPGLDARLNEMADHVIASIEEGKPDEALIIGHSFGTSMATLLTSRVLARRPEWGKADSPLTLVTLGQTQTLLSHLPKAHWFRSELARIAAFPDFNWLDFSSPPDGACYALVNVLEFLPDPPAGMPKLLNAQFHKLFSEQHMAEARDYRMLMHFYYLQSPDFPQIGTDLYDFVLLIGGTEKASDRYAARESGKPFFRKD
jgi:pimeloyl-ACP methyl ester carboxylesterase